MLHDPFYDPNKSYYENWTDGPFNGFADGVVVPEPVEPRFTFFGYPLSYPFGIPAGPLVNAKFVKAALDKGFDIPIYKTVRTREHPCHAWPNVLGVEIEGELTLEKAQKPLVARNVYKEPLSITNSFGNPSYTPEYWMADIASAISHARPGQLIMGSLEGTKWKGQSPDDYVRDWVEGMNMLVRAGVKVVEANFSCPNEGTTNLLCFDVPKVKLISNAIKEKIGNVPFVIKLAYFHLETLRELVKEVGTIVDGFAAINTISAVILDEKGSQALPGEKRLRSGVCGYAIKWAGLDMTRQLKALREEFGMHYTIIGVGGVTTPKDFKEYREAGADVVMSATGAMWNPYLAKEIREAYPDA